MRDYNYIATRAVKCVRPVAATGCAYKKAHERENEESERIVFVVLNVMFVVTFVKYHPGFPVIGGTREVWSNPSVN